MVEKRSLKFKSLKNEKVKLLIAIIILLSSLMAVASLGDTSPIANCGPDKLNCQNINTPVQFNASASYDPNGSILSYEWDFGDSTTGTGVAPNHTYTSYRWNGSAYLPFIVHLNVTNNLGASNITSQQVTIWIAGDANGDGVVNILDASVVGLKWNSNDACADLNNDGKVNILDASIIGLNWARKALDNTPPSGVTHLVNVSFAQNYINWTWTDPADTDFASVSIWIDGEFKSNVPKGNQFYEATGFSADSEHNISTKTTDTSGNLNQTWVNHTARTAPTILELPPDPVTVAPPVDNTVATNIATSTAFLYTGSNPIQTGVADGTIEQRRVAVLRGRVLNREGMNLSGINITILSHPEFGSTLSRADGMFDMAVNGGGLLTVNYEKAGYLTAQRRVQTPWQDYVWLPDVVMIQADGQVTSIDLFSSEPIQVARSSQITDSDGTRQATLLFPQGIKVKVTLPDGSMQALTTMHVRATEYTVGANGPEAMPAELPPTSAYTYAVEFSVDEVGGARNVSFDRPIYSYVENFLNFSVGSAVPVGYYNRNLGIWMPSDNGRVIKILSITSGKADLDVNGTGQIANATTLASLNIIDAEQQQLALLYTPGQSLWRVPITHFTPLDYNWPYVPPPDVTPPNQSIPNKPPEKDPCEEGGSIIECQNQVLGETISIAGTPFTLNYRSNRVPGTFSTLEIPLTGQTIPGSLLGIKLAIYVAGREFKYSFIPQSNLSYVFEWDGKDAYGRTLQGSQPVTIEVSYFYKGYYITVRPDYKQAFARFPPEVNFSGNRARKEISLSKTWTGITIGEWNARNQGLGSWSLNIHHAYDPVGRVLYLGNGERRSSQDLNNIVTTVAGTSFPAGYSGDGGPAIQAKLNNPFGIAVGQDGSLYIADSDNNRIRRVGPDGIIATVAGTGFGGYSGDGGPATQATLRIPAGIAVGQDGSLYIADRDNFCIRRISPDGIITTVVGTSGILRPSGIAVGPDGSLYIADMWNARIWHVGPDGKITMVAGTGFEGYSGDGGPATQANLHYPSGIAVGPDGSFYIAEFQYNHRIRRVGPDGIITTVAGTGLVGTWLGGYSGDGGLAIQANLNSPYGIAVSTDGSLYISDTKNNRIRRVGPDEIITTIAGTGFGGYSGDDGPATQANLSIPAGIAVGPDGSLYIADRGNIRIRHVTPPLPGLTVGDIIISSEDSSELYVFSNSGRHMRTLDALTGAVRYNFTYDSSGQLTDVTDGDGNEVTIERDASGNATAIISPYGQRTSLTLDSNGYLAGITNPAGESAQLGYTDGGLLTSMTDRRGKTYRFSYDAKGRLIKDEDPAGGSKSLSRNDTTNGYSVIHATGLNLNTTYKIEQLSTGDRRLVNTFPSGLKTETVIGTNGSQTITYADGTRLTQVFGHDPRFGMQAPVLSNMTVKTPGGLIQTTNSQRTAILGNMNNPLSMQSQNDTRSINGHTYTSIFNATWKNITTNTPSGRKTFTTVDNKGRIVDRKIPGIIPVNYTYDAHGRLSATTQGTRSYAFSYDSQGNLGNITDPLSRTVEFEYDTAGRVTTQNLPDGHKIQYTYDANGNILSISPPGRPNHDFNYTPVDLIEDYIPPDIGLGIVQTRYTYNIDRQLTRVTRPDGTTIDLGYDNAGRLSTITYPQGTTYRAYDPATGNIKNIAISGGGKITYTYDGTLLTDLNWSGTISGDIHRTYDNNFNIISESINGANTVNFQYDLDGFITRTGLLNLSRDPQNGLFYGTSLGNITDILNYNSFGEIAAYQAASSGENLFSVNYTRDNLGRIIQKNETIDGLIHIYNYTYDLSGRLIEVRKDGITISQYIYDANGNRLSFTGIGGTISGTYDNQDRLLHYGSTTYNYTVNGELLSKTNGSQTTNYQYDVWGNLRNVTLPDGRQMEYLIDGQDRRIGKKVNGVLVQGFLYKDQLTPIAELDGSGNIVSRFVYASGGNTPDYMVKGGNNYRIISDLLGSPRIVIDTISDEIVQRIDYDEFGNVMKDTNPGFQPFGFAGGLYDQNNRLIRFGARDYDTELGRWTVKDTLYFNGGSPNFYVYVTNDPINSKDASGLQTPLGFCRDPFMSLTHSGTCYRQIVKPGCPGFHACYDDTGKPYDIHIDKISPVGGTDSDICMPDPKSLWDHILTPEYDKVFWRDPYFGPISDI